MHLIDFYVIFDKCSSNFICGFDGPHLYALFILNPMNLLLEFNECKFVRFLVQFWAKFVVAIMEFMTSSILYMVRMRIFSLLEGF